MKHMIGRGSATACLAVLAIGALASGCDWSQFGFSSGHNGDNSGDTTITPANVSTLTAHFSATDGTAGAVTAQAIVNGVLYASDPSGLEAFSANGTTGCSGSPTGCSPLWSYSPGPLVGSPAVVSGVVYVPTSSGLDAFDAAGHTNCSGTPTVCQPLWSASGTFGTPTVSNGTVYVTTSGTLDAFDASGITNCAGSPKVCSPVWTSSNTYGTVTVSGGIAYAPSFLGGTYGGIVALDANGTNGCSGSPKVCTPLWEDLTNYPVTGGYAVVSGTALYVNTFYSPGPRQVPHSDMESFDANGVNGCSGTPKVCSPLWSEGTLALNTVPLAGDGSEFDSVPLSGFGIYAIDPNGALEWQAPDSTNATAIGGSVLYGTNGTDVHAYDAEGSTGCSGFPKICGSLWSAPGTGAIIANGTLYVSATNSSGDGEVVAYGLP
jgi:hypothetical protein